MCARYTLTKPKDAAFALALDLPFPGTLPPRFNIAPRQDVAAVQNVAPRAIELLRWGLIPSWAKDASIGDHTINARAETLAEKPSFRQALRKRRCLILADGFYEWPRDKTVKTPQYLTLADGRPFAFAGLWDQWKSPEGKLVRSCTIVTTAANSLIVPFHDRMPVILDPSNYDLWLTPGELEPAQLQPLLAPLEPAALKSTRVSTFANNARNDAPECVAPA